VSPAPRELWSAALASDGNANVHQSPAWIDAICATGGYRDASRLYETEDGRTLVLPMVQRVGPLGALPVRESLPAPWGTGGLVASGGDLRPADVAAVWRDVRAQPGMRVRIRPEHAAVDAWHAAERPRGVRVEQQVKAVVDLRGGFDQVWRRFKGSARTAIRKAERADLQVESGCTPDLAREYHRLYLQWNEDRARERGLPVPVMVRRAERAEPLQKFLSVSRHLGPACRFWLVRHEGRAVAAAITLVHGDHATYWRSFSDKTAAGPLSANNLLQKHLIEYACQAGCADYNMGWSGTPSLLDYKRSYGAVPLDFPVFTYEPVKLPDIRGAVRATARRAVDLRSRPS
jgi:CelD/BcsL family acetyltransferase involved in cellulose biosynthesis